jgi:hypothetical protein
MANDKKLTKKYQQEDLTVEIITNWNNIFVTFVCFRQWRQESKWNTNIRKSCFCRVHGDLDCLEWFVQNIWMHSDGLLIFMLRHCQQVKEKSSELNTCLDWLFLPCRLLIFLGKAHTLREAHNHVGSIWTLICWLVETRFCVCVCVSFP